jgi:murein DD-endopeptidase MepM/ murein hydrolase activator NlpD
MTVLDSSTFSSTEQCKDLFGNAIRTHLGYNAFGNTTVFDAKVLTDPMRMSEAMSSGFTTSKIIKQLLNFVENVASKIIGDAEEIDAPEASEKDTKTAPTAPPGPHADRFIVRARIDDIYNSPHSFLPDPCTIAFANNPQAAAKVIALHTTFISTAETTQLEIKTGDIIKVRLSQFSDGTYNLQYGEIVGITTVNAAPDPTCEAISQLISEDDKFNFQQLMAGAYSLLQDFTKADTSGLSDYRLDPLACTSGAFYLIHPLQSPTNVNSPMGWRGPVYKDGKQISGGRMHAGVDLRAGENTALYAAADGVVERDGVGFDPGRPGCGGMMLVINHTSADGNTYKTRSFHLNRIDVRKGDPVRRGQVVGVTGNTGTCTNGPHLHFELYVNEKVTDPLEYIKTIQMCGRTPPVAASTTDPTKGPGADSDAETDMSEPVSEGT